MKKDGSYKIKVRACDRSPRNFKTGKKRVVREGQQKGKDVIIGWTGEDMLFKFDGFIYK